MAISRLNVRGWTHIDSTSIKSVSYYFPAINTPTTVLGNLFELFSIMLRYKNTLYYVLEKKLSQVKKLIEIFIEKFNPKDYDGIIDQVSLAEKKKFFIFFFLLL